MYRVALNVAISFYRRERTRTRHALPAGEHFLETIAGSESEPDEIRLLYQFIETLDELNKALILLTLTGTAMPKSARYWVSANPMRAPESAG